MDTKQSMPCVPKALSCETCHKRKVKCDKVPGRCSNCANVGIRCTVRNRKKNAKKEDARLLSRLSMLEELVQDLRNGEARDNNTMNSLQNGKGVYPGSPTLNDETGRLILEKGRSRYVDHSFWTSLSDEVTSLKELIYDEPDGEYVSSSPSSNQSRGRNSFSKISFDVQLPINNLRDFHPSNQMRTLLWNVFAQNVDPIVKILHLPSVKDNIFTAYDSLGNLGKPIESLIFVVFFAAVTSMTPNDCREILGEDKKELLVRYRFAAELALERAGLLTTQEVVALQAFVIFLSCIRQEDTRLVWMLTGNAVRIAQALGIHRDGTFFSLSPFETEMRRRLWWQICLLDMQVSEVHGSPPTIVPNSFDTKFPLNVNDSDISEEDTEVQSPRTGFSEMVYSLIRFEILKVVKPLIYLPSYSSDSLAGMENRKIDELEVQIERCAQHVESKYLKHLDVSKPFHQMTLTGARLILAKVWLTLHQPLHGHQGNSALKQSAKDHLFVTSIDIIEYSRQLQTETAVRRWSWTFCSYIRWHAVIYLLFELCMRTKGHIVERAWNNIDAIFGEGGDIITDARNSALWHSMRKLMIRAKTKRLTDRLRMCNKAPRRMEDNPLIPGESQCDTTAEESITNDRLDDQNSELTNLIIESDLGSPKATQHSSVMRVSPPIGLAERIDCGVDLSGQGNATIYPVTSNSGTGIDYPSLGDQSFSNLQSPRGHSAWGDWERLVRSIEMESSLQGDIDGAGATSNWPWHL